MRTRESLLTTEDTATALSEAVRRIGRPLRDSADLDPLMDRIGESRYVLLGEASHGTADYYLWRRRLSERLIREKGFSFLAVEGDWPDCYRVNRYVRGREGAGSTAYDALSAFRRWPTWMWANQEIAGLADWLRDYNQGRAPDQQVGFYGLDVYSLWDSLYAVLNYLREHHPEATAAAYSALRCFEPYGEDVQEYARATRLVPTSCEEEVLRLLQETRAAIPVFEDNEREAAFNADQNALVARNAEAYYRAMVRGGPSSWNVRDRHMVETLDRLMTLHGPQAKAIVWEHNTHIGDARATDMAEAGMVNTGQLTRERHEAEGVVLVGFASYSGTVIAGSEWDAPMRRMRVPDARPGSWEDLFHQAGAEDRLLLLDECRRQYDFEMPRGHRAIGVVYHPEYERYGNYVPTVLPQRYDALLYIDRSEALHPLHQFVDDAGEPPETYPFAV